VPVVVVVVVVMVASACSTQGKTNPPVATGSARAESAPSAAGKVAIASEVALANALAQGHLTGFSTPGFPSDLATFRKLEKDAGTHADIASWYTPLGTDFDAAAVARISSQGLLPLIEIDSDKIPMADIADGKWDRFLTAYARAVANYHFTVAIDFDHEFNGDWSTWGYPHTSASTFVAAWRLLVTIFRENGATNVIWVWNPNVAVSGTVSMKAWYPGDQYVTWVGLDGYFLSSAATFGSVFGKTLRQLSSFTNKRVLIVETGAEPGGKRGTQIDSLFAGLEATPRIIGFIWFDYDKGPGHDWTLQGDKAALTAFAKGAVAYLHG
jgi:mannan endo-1,4-beta-mannosidase